VPKDKILLRDTPTTKIQPHEPDEAPKDKTLLCETRTTKIEKPDEVSKDKTHLHDLSTHKTRPYKSVEKIEVYYTYITYIHTHIYIVIINTFLKCKKKLYF